MFSKDSCVSTFNRTNAPSINSLVRSCELLDVFTSICRTLYGFSNKEELNLFLKLIQVKGVGPKMALPMLATGRVDAIYDAIERENILYLTKFPKVGDKVARQIILDLKGKLVKNDDLFTNDGLDELMAVLESLGYKKGDIKKILPQVDASLSIEQQIKDALKLLMR